MAYNHKIIEKKWQKYWDKNQVFKTSDLYNKPKYYILDMFPYPSGSGLHVGHPLGYIATDIIARYKRHNGFNVLHPMGWDAFGMPAENAAMEKNVHPGDWTYQNIADMRAQLKPMGLSIDWSREFATCDPEYYGQQQSMFIDMMSKGLVYRKNAVVNWDPVDMTVLANEQVIDGKGWRSGAEVESKELSQWFLKTSSYSEELLSYLNELNRWPEKVKIMQSNWIGKSVGAERTFLKDIKTESFILDELDNIADILEKRLISSKNRGKTITVKIKYSDFKQQTRAKTVESYLQKKIDFFPIRFT